MYDRQKISRWAAAAILAGLGTVASNAQAQQLLSWINGTVPDATCGAQLYAMAWGMDASFNVVCGVASSGSSATTTCPPGSAYVQTALTTDMGSDVALAQSAGGGDCPYSQTAPWLETISSRCTPAVCPQFNVQTFAYGH